MGLRWSKEGDARYIIADSAHMAVGSFDAYPASLDEDIQSLSLLDDGENLADFFEIFADEWVTLSETLPKGLQLKDELDALPDPRDQQPRVKIKRRKN